MPRIPAAAVFLWWIATLAWPRAGYADTPRWAPLADSVFQNYGVDEGLPNRTVTAIAEDGDGFLWIGTQGGLARWDGYRFRTYHPDPDDASSLPDGFITCLLTDRHGRLWVGTAGGGVARYEPDRDAFRTWPAGSDGPSHVYIGAIANDGDGGVWVGTERGLDHVEGDVFAHEGDETARALAGRRVRTLLLDRNRTLWVGTDAGLFHRARDAAAFSAVPVQSSAGGLQPGLYSLAEDEAGTIWLGTTRGVYAIGPIEASAHPVRETPQPVSAVAEVARGEVWAATDGDGVLAIDSASGKTRPIHHEPSRVTSLADDQTRTIYRDRGGLVWVGSGSGLSRYDFGQRSVATLYGGPDRVVSNADVMSVLATGDGRVWLGLYTSGVDVIDPSAGRIARLVPDATKPETALPADHIFALAAGDGGSVYLGTNEGLYRADAAARGVVRIPVVDGSPDAPVFALLPDRGALWVGSFGQGLYRLDPATGTTGTHVGPDRLTDGRVTSIVAAAQDVLWVGTLDGLNRIDTGTGGIEQLRPDRNDPQSLSNGFVSSILIDRQGRLWVATLGGGINVLESRDGDGRANFRRLGSDQGLPSANIEKLLLDRKGNVWASADDGIAVIDPSLVVRTLRRAEGVTFPGYWVSSGAVTPEDELLFGGSGGLTIVRPDNLTSWEYHPPVVVTDVRVGGAPIPSSRFNDSHDATPLVVPSGANSLAVEFASLDYSAPDRNAYAYRLVGFDDDWVATDWTRRVASYTNLPPGDYTLKLRGSNRDGDWTETTHALPIHVLPAWYQTAWFRVVWALAALTLFATLIRSRTALLSHRQRQLEAVVAERTAELEARTQELVETHKELERIAYFDALTSLPNRRMFSEYLNRQLAQARRTRRHFVLLMLDLDWFKEINDTLGHDAGDALLVAAAGRFKSAVRESDFVARFGGDEFAILLPESYDRDGIEKVCRRIVESFRDPVLHDGNEMRTSPSIGIAVYSDDGDTQERLIKSADIALYAAKRAGRNCWRWYSARERAEAAAQ